MLKVVIYGIDETCPECAKAAYTTAIAIATPVCVALLKDVLKNK